jgi:hypothetical protein
VRSPVGALAGAALLVASIAAADQGEGLERVTRVGPVEVTLRLEPAAPVIGDPVRLEVDARAEPGVELLMPEFGEALDRFLIADFSTKEELDDAGRTRALQRYVLEPPRSGPQSIPPLLVEFIDRRPDARPAPDDADAYEVLTERIDFSVESVVPEGAVAELKPLPPALDPLDRGGARLWIGGVAIALLAVAGLVAWRLRAAWLARRRRRSAFEEAWTRLEALLARPRPGPDEIDAFYVALSDVIRRYLEDRFELRSPELTTEEFLDVAGRSPDLNADLRALLLEFLRRADLVKFAGHQPASDEIEESIAAARRFLEETRETSDAEETLPARVEPANA